MVRKRATITLGLLVSTLLIVSACGSPPASNGGNSGTTAATATSAAGFGGMDQLVAAAQKEGRLNVIALPPEWANYGRTIDEFSQKFGIKVVSSQPDASSQEEINAAKQLAGTDRVPDVFDLGQNVVLANTGLFAPYQVQTWKDIPAPLKQPDGLWASDYGGFMSVGYDASKVPAPTSIQDLLKPEYKGKVALEGDPTQAASAFYGVVAASLSNGGSPDDIAPGVDFFAQLKKIGNFLPITPTPATIASGQTPVVLDWDYLHTAATAKLVGQIDWKVVVPENTAVGSYYAQAINKDAVHPAAARLWEEFLYSDQGQNNFLAGFAHPVRAEAMKRAGTIDQKALDNLPPVEGTPVYLTPQQVDAAKQYLSEHWASAVG
ncbi:ABC transporter substrate-binding protein [Kitasatospora sp. NBC_00240]|uniref:ABC transporter substrate-binding protein n=1 Tax=Kitasatospora sp. NBC_00240 TaxID=2903567 RepID=UPI002251279A|nr:ABC transporter substrate-binding protein [Kitasatospora sp. NBC_00240]MCX5208350.1 ABC transporter substrate-binding protein [Kitasatospora sp. NBC_00240]